jgi:hypothetical protein
MKIIAGFLALSLIACHTRAGQTWQGALAAMPLETNATELTRTNCVNLMLRSFRSNDTVKVLVFMPGATDEFNFYRRANAHLTNPAPSMLDAVTALTNQTRIRADFFPPMLLLHSPEDPLDIELRVADQPTLDRFKQTKFLPPHLLSLDQDYDHLLPQIEDKLKVKLYPPINSTDTFHFYRHSFAAWNITQWQVLEVMALAGKTTLGIGTNQLFFDGDARWMTTPSGGMK